MKTFSDVVEAALTDTPQGTLELAEKLGETRLRVHNALTGLVQAKRATKVGPYCRYTRYHETNPVLELETAVARMARRAA